MAAASISFLFLCGFFGTSIGSGSEPASTLGMQNNFTRLENKVLQLENSIAAIPQNLQGEIEDLLLSVLEDVHKKFKNYTSTNKEMVEALRKDLSRVEQSLRNQTLLIDELKEDFQNSCFGEPPSLLNGRVMDFERKHGSDVRYRCDEYFWMTENSTVRCSYKKWEGQPPVCTHTGFFDTSFLLRARYYGGVYDVTCSSEVSNQKMEITGLNGTLPSGANIYCRGKASVLHLSGVAESEKRGVYNCGYEIDRTRTGISFHFDKNGRFVRQVVASIGDIAELCIDQSHHPSYRWFHDGGHIPSGDGRGNLTITGVKATDAGNYERNEQGYFSLSFKLVVRGCPSTLFGEGCDLECPPCYNGGTCHDHLGVCVCPPGFTGTNCELACGVNKFGANCSESCQGEDCQWQVFCKPYPSGCSCAPGYWGYHCTYRCSEGMFGADCKQTCRCAEGTCDPYTGACPGGCSSGWTGQSCQIPA